MLNGSLHHHYLQSGILSPTIEQEHQTKHDHDQQQYQQHFSTESPSQCTNQCLKFRYFTIFLVCTTCLTLLSASLATHKWIISRPIRMLKLNNGQKNSTALMLSASLNDHHPTKQTTSKNINDNLDPLQASLSIFSQNHQQQNNPNPPLIDIIDSNSFPDQDGFVKSQSVGPGQNKKFQGEIYFGLFRGLKILNYGFGDRQSSISGMLSPLDLMLIVVFIGEVFILQYWYFLFFRDWIYINNFPAWERLLFLQWSHEWSKNSLIVGKCTFNGTLHNIT